MNWKIASTIINSVEDSHPIKETDISYIIALLLVSTVINKEDIDLSASNSKVKIIHYVLIISITLYVHKLNNVGFKKTYPNIKSYLHTQHFRSLSFEIVELHHFGHNESPFQSQL